jgi:hypothetical protein
VDAATVPATRERVEASQIDGTDLQQRVGEQIGTSFWVWRSVSDLLYLSSSTM